MFTRAAIGMHDISCMHICMIKLEIHKLLSSCVLLTITDSEIKHCSNVNVVNSVSVLFVFLTLRQSIPTYIVACKLDTLIQHVTARGM